MMNPLHHQTYLPVTAETELSPVSAHSGGDDNNNNNTQQVPLQARVLPDYPRVPSAFVNQVDQNRAVGQSLMISSMGLIALLVFASALSRPPDYITNYIYSSNDMYYDARGTSTVSLESLSRLQAITKLSELDQISSVYLFVPNDLIHTSACDDNKEASQRKLMYVEQVVSGLGSIDYYYDSGLVTEQKIVRFSQKDPTTLLLTEPNPKFRAHASLSRDFPETIISSFSIVENVKNGLVVSCEEFGNRTSMALATRGYHKDAKYTSILPSSAKLSMISLNISSGYYNKQDANSMPIIITTRLSILYIGSEIDVDSTATSAGCNENSYVPRVFHPKSGLNEIVYYNESAYLYQRRDKHVIQRHHIARNGTNHVMPIAFFVDFNIPEPFLSAALEGIGWWDEAFRYAGWPVGTFRVLPAPRDMDPFSTDDIVSVKDRSNMQSQDCVYSSINYVHWIHRDYRGYSVGQRITNTLDGRILKGHVRLESLRMRQDVLIASSVLIPPEATEEERENLLEEITQFVVQRVKVLAAHEVGHALGLAHNFAGSTSSLSRGGSSVMDYPPPLFAIDGDRLILNSNPYMSGIGNFDKVAIDYGYREFEIDNDFQAYIQRNHIIDVYKSKGLSREEKEFLLASERIKIGEDNFNYVYLNDQDTEKSDWRDSKWDQGTAENSHQNPIESLENCRKVRRMALNQLHTNNLNPVEALYTAPQSSLLTESLPVILLLHRYEVKSVSKLIGGYSIEYTLLNGNALSSSSFSPHVYQYEALQGLLKFLTPNELQIPYNLRKFFEPLAFGYESNVLGGVRDILHSRLLASEYDGIALIEVQVQLILENLLNPGRIERLVSNNNGEFVNIDLNSVLGNISEAIIPSSQDEEQDSHYFFMSKAVPLYMYVNTMLNLLSNSKNNQHLSVIPRALINRQVSKLGNIFAKRYDMLTNHSDFSKGSRDKWASLYHFLSDASSKRQTFMEEIVLPQGPPI